MRAADPGYICETDKDLCHLFALTRISPGSTRKSFVQKWFLLSFFCDLWLTGRCENKFSVHRQALGRITRAAYAWQTGLRCDWSWLAVVTVVSSPALTAASPGYQWASPVVLPLLQALLLLEGRKKQKWAPTGNTWERWLKVRRLCCVDKIFSPEWCIIQIYTKLSCCYISVPPGISPDRGSAASSIEV